MPPHADEDDAKKKIYLKIKPIDIAYGVLKTVLTQAENVHQKYTRFRELVNTNITEKHLNRVFKNTVQILSNINKNVASIHDDLLNEFPEWKNEVPPLFCARCAIKTESHCSTQTQLEGNTNETNPHDETLNFNHQDNNLIPYEQKPIKDEPLPDDCNSSCETVIFDRIDGKPDSPSDKDHIDFEELLRIILKPSIKLNSQDELQEDLLCSPSKENNGSELSSEKSYVFQSNSNDLNYPVSENEQLEVNDSEKSNSIDWLQEIKEEETKIIEEQETDSIDWLQEIKQEELLLESTLKPGNEPEEYQNSRDEPPVNKELTKVDEIYENIMTVLAQDLSNSEEISSEESTSLSSSGLLSEDDRKKCKRFKIDSSSPTSKNCIVLLEKDSSIDKYMTEEAYNGESVTKNLSVKSCSEDENITRLNIEEQIKLHGIRECTVLLERPPKSLNLDLIINKLSNLSSLKRRRRRSSSDRSEGPKRNKLCLKKSLKHNNDFNTSNNSQDSEESEDSLTDNTIPMSQIDDGLSSLSPQEVKVQEALDLVDQWLNVSDSSSVTENNAENSSKEKNKKNTEYKKKNKKKLSEEEKDRRRWRSDPILNGKLSSDSDLSDSENETFKKKKRPLQLPESDEESCKIETLTSDTDNSDVIILQSTPKKEVKKIEFISDATISLSDSENEFVSKKKKTPVIELSDDNEPGSGKKGRKNIRALIADEDLNEATQRAREQEHERISRLQKKSKSLEAILSQSENIENLLVLDVDDNGVPLVTVDQNLCDRLKEHQKEGVKFMWNSCFESIEKIKSDAGSGCILAHCMGLGKTFQVITLIHTLFTHEITNVKHILVVCPLSTVRNWQHEFKIGLKKVEKSRNFSVFALIGNNEDKISIIMRWGKGKGVLIVGYEAFESITNEKKLESKYSNQAKEYLLSMLVDPGPQLIVCDEGHLLKNGRTLRTKALNRVSTKRRIVLTGTPIQNNLKEYYYMVQFVKPNLLGTYKEYNNSFVNPIANGQYDDSSSFDIHMMKRRTHVLQRILKETLHRVEVSELKTYLKEITDYAIFVQLHPVQVKLYKEFISHALRIENNKTKVHFLRDYQILGLICSHPYLLQLQEEREKKFKKDGKKRQEHDTIEVIQDIVQTYEGIPNEWWKSITPHDIKENLEYGTKFKIMKLIIEECEAVGDKVLIFSQRKVELDAIEHFLQTVGTKNCKKWLSNLDYFRMDGEVPPATRSNLCDSFNRPSNTRNRVFIMSHRVGGLGLNLVAANRVILMSANFNPSYDTQSVYRAYRFGQTKPCFVYRLLAKETMEEKVYQRCITKLAQAGRVVDKHQIQRHYNRDDVSEFYKILPEENVQRAVPNVPADGLLAKILQNEESIFKFHEHEALLENKPEEDLTDLEKAAAWEEYNKNEQLKMNYATQSLANVSSQVAGQKNIPQQPYQLGGPQNPTHNLQNNSLNNPSTSSNYNIQRHIVNLSNLSTIVTMENPQSTILQSNTSNVNSITQPSNVNNQTINPFFNANSSNNARDLSQGNGSQNKFYYVGNNPYTTKKNSPNNSTVTSQNVINPFSRRNTFHTHTQHNIKGIVVYKGFVEKLMRANRNIKIHPVVTKITPVLSSPVGIRNKLSNNINQGGQPLSKNTHPENTAITLPKQTNTVVKNSAMTGDKRIAHITDKVNNKEVLKPGAKVAPFSWLNQHVKIYNDIINIDDAHSESVSKDKSHKIDKENKKTEDDTDFRIVQNRINSNSNVSLEPLTNNLETVSDIIDLEKEGS